MALTELYSGTEAISTTEWSLTTDTAGPDADTTDGVFQVFLDVSDMIAGDVLQIRLYEKCRSGDTQRLAQEWILSGAQASPLWVSDSILLMHGWDITLLAISGTITVLWSIRSTVDPNIALIKAVTDLLPNAGALSSLATAAAVDTIDNFLDTEVAAVLAAVDTEVAAIKAVTDALPNAGALTSLATQASVNIIDDLLDTEVAAIKTETDKIPATITKVDAIKTKTDSLTFTVAGKTDANLTHVNEIEVSGDGETGTEWGPL